MNQENRKAGKGLSDHQLTQQIIGAAIRVHRALGPGFLESIYEQALAEVGEHRLDFLVEDRIVVELKAIKAFEDIHFAIGRSYLKAANLQDGLLFNFATAPLTIKRFCRERTEEPPDFLT